VTIRLGTAVVCLVGLGAACDGAEEPEEVADRFVEAYFVTADQDEALKYATGRARRVLEHELDLVREVRSGGYGVEEAHPPTYVKRGVPRRESGSRVTVPYEVDIATGNPGIRKSVEIHVERSREGWKVASFRMRDPAP
jgi:hypothetical protein